MPEGKLTGKSDDGVSEAPSIAVGDELANPVSSLLNRSNKQIDKSAAFGGRLAKHTVSRRSFGS